MSITESMNGFKAIVDTMKEDILTVEFGFTLGCRVHMTRKAFFNQFPYEYTKTNCGEYTQCIVERDGVKYFTLV